MKFSIGFIKFTASDLCKTQKKRPARIILPDRRILGRIGASAAAALVILLLGLWISKMDKVYVPPHTGARYHAARDCVQMTNPQAARAYPAFIGRILFRPCGECGQYDPAWANIHMLPEQTVQAGLDVGASWLIPVHWGSFCICNHPWDDSIRRVTEAANAAGLPLATPPIGKTVRYAAIRTERRTWWDDLPR